MPIITLTTDYGLRDPYAGQLKGVLLSACPTAQLVDLTHLIEPYDLVSAAFHLAHTWANFPKGTIHVCTVRAHGDFRTPFLCFAHRGHTFILPDNGLPFLLFSELDERSIVRLPQGADGRASAKSIVADAVAQLSLGLDPRRIGIQARDLLQVRRPEPVVRSSLVRGAILHIDNYGNAVLNIHRDLVERHARGRRIVTRFSPVDAIDGIVEHYTDVEEGEPLARYNARGYLEIAINMGRIAQLYGLEPEQLVHLEFEGEVSADQHSLSVSSQPPAST